MDRLYENTNHCLEALSLEAPLDLKLYAAMSGIEQVHVLIDRTIWDSMRHLAKIRPRQSGAIRAESLVKDYVELGWHPDIAVDLSEVRNAWAHGDASIQSGRVRAEHGPAIFRRGLRFVDLMAYVRVGLAALQGFHLQIAFNQSLGAGSTSSENR
jgi:hypothetical protein